VLLILKTCLCYVADPEPSMGPHEAGLRAGKLGDILAQWVARGRQRHQRRSFLYSQTPGVCPSTKGVLGVDFRQRYDVRNVRYPGRWQARSYEQWIKEINNEIRATNDAIWHGLHQQCRLGCDTLPAITHPNHAQCALYEDSVHHPILSFAYLNDFLARTCGSTSDLAAESDSMEDAYEAEVTRL